MQLRASDGRTLNRWLWGAQILLAAIVGAYVIKAILPIPVLAEWMRWPDDVPPWVVRLTGTVEGLAAIGLVGSAALRVCPVLTVLSAAGLVLVQILAIAFHVVRGEWITIVSANLVLLGLSAFVLWGRSRLSARRRAC